MILKKGKSPNSVSSYRPISLLPVLSKLFERLLLDRLDPIISENDIIPRHQFGFCKHHSTIEQVHRVANKVRQSLERKEYCSAIFLDIQQAFDRVWLDGLLYKIKNKLPYSFFPLLKSYLEGRMFRVKENDEYSGFYTIKAGVPQSSILGSMLYTIFTSDIPSTKGVITATFADDTAVLSNSRDLKMVSRDLQLHLLKLQTVATELVATLKNPNQCPKI